MERSNIYSSIPTFISFFGALILCLSVAYDYGYFLTLGMSFSEIPTTVSDHIRGSLTWIPRTLIVIFVVLVFELFNRRVEQGMTEEEIIQSSSKPKLVKIIRESPKYLIIPLALFVPLTIFIDIDIPIQAFQFSLIIIWFIIHNFFFGHQRVIDRSTKEFYLFTRWIPAVLVYVVFNGIIAADIIKKGKGKKFIFELEGHKTLETFVLARTLSQYYLLWDDNKEKPVLLSEEQVLSFYPKVKAMRKNKPQDNISIP